MIAKSACPVLQKERGRKIREISRQNEMGLSFNTADIF